MMALNGYDCLYDPAYMVLHLNDQLEAHNRQQAQKEKQNALKRGSSRRK